MENLLPVSLGVAVHRVARATEREERHRGGDPDVHPDHARLDLVFELPRGGPALGVDASRIGEPARVDQVDHLVHVLAADDAHHRPEDLLFGDGHVGRDVVEDGRAYEKAVRQAVHFGVAAVEHQLRALGDALLDVAQHALLVRGAHDRAHARLLVQPVAQAHRLGRRHELRDQLVGHIADRRQDRAREAALARAPVVGGDQGRHRRVELRVRQDRHNVLGAAERLHALTRRAAALVDVFGRRRGPHEGDPRDVRVIQDRVDHLLGAVHHVDDTLREAHRVQDLEDLGLGHRHLLRRLQDVSVAAHECVRQEPPRHHRREIVGRDRREHPQRLPVPHAVDVLGDVLERVAAHQGRHAGGVLDVLDHPPHLAPRLVDHLALLAREGPGDVLEVRLEGLLQPEQVARAAQRRGSPPLPERCLGRLHRLVDVRLRPVGHLRDLLALGRVPDVAENLRVRVRPLPVDVVLHDRQ